MGGGDGQAKGRKEGEGERKYIEEPASREGEEIVSNYRVRGGTEEEEEGQEKESESDVGERGWRAVVVGEGGDTSV